MGRQKDRVGFHLFALVVHWSTSGGIQAAARQLNRRRWVLSCHSPLRCMRQHAMAPLGLTLTLMLLLAEHAQGSDQRRQAVSVRPKLLAADSQEQHQRYTDHNRGKEPVLTRHNMSLGEHSTPL